MNRKQVDINRTRLAVIAALISVVTIGVESTTSKVQASTKVQQKAKVVDVYLQLKSSRGGSNLENEIAVRSFRNSVSIYAELNPSRADCNKAIKLLTQYERLADKLRIRISDRRLRQLNEKRQNGTITDNDLPGTLYREFPAIFRGKSLNQIRAICNRPIPVR